MKSKNHHAPIEEGLSPFTLNMVPDPVFVFQLEEGPRFRCIAANTAGLQATGFGEDAVVGRLLEEIEPPEEAALSVDRFEAAMQADAPIRSERTIDVPAGRLSFQITTAAIRDEGGSCTHIVTLTSNITDLKEAERLQEVEQRFRTAFNHAPIGMALAGTDGRYLQVNSALVEMLGYTEEQLTALTWMDITHPDDLETNVQALSGLLTGATESFTLEKRFVRGDGKVRWGKLGVSVVRDPQGSPLYLIGQYVDVTNLKRTEQLLAQQADGLATARDEAVATSDAKTAFLTNMSHELRTPLTGVIGMSAQLEKDTFGPLNDKQREYVSHISRSGNHLLSLINDLLDLARVESGKDDATLEPVSLASVVTASLALVREVAVAGEVSLVADLPNDLPRVMGDERRLKQVFVNLLSNAIKFTPAGGSVGVEAATRGSTTEVTVWDTGGGIPDKNLGRIFQAFEQAEAEVGKSEGTGLGLTLAHRLVELHGGTITVESTVGVGSRFTVSLPSHENPAINTRWAPAVGDRASRPPRASTRT